MRPFENERLFQRRPYITGFQVALEVRRSRAESMYSIEGGINQSHNSRLVANDTRSTEIPSHYNARHNHYRALEHAWEHHGALVGAIP
jgi:hypothetical protein